MSSYFSEPTITLVCINVLLIMWIILSEVSDNFHDAVISILYKILCVVMIIIAIPIFLVYALVDLFIYVISKLIDKIFKKGEE